MRKNTARKWVHLLLDLLPVLIIPIFAIYLINHNPQGLQVETGGYEVQEKYQTNELMSVNDFVDCNIYKIDYDESASRQSLNNFLIDHGGIYIQYIYYEDTNYENYIEFYDVDSNNIFLDYNSTKHILEISNDTDTPTIEVFTDYLYIVSDYWTEYAQEIWNFYVDINISDYNVYEYTYNVGMIYDNTDIGSQLIYSMYIPIHDYFNMTNLFNFGDIYNWINTSMFGGNAPLPIFIVYNVIVYEFLIDLIFLIYSIFMFIIDFTSELLARCFSFSNKGGTR